jgi:hypothetical protein
MSIKSPNCGKTMNIQQAVPVLEALARGIDPETGEVLTEHSPFNNLTVIRALQFAVATLQQPRAKLQSSGRPGNAGRAWSEDEDRQLVTAFDGGMALKDSGAQAIPRADRRLRAEATCKERSFIAPGFRMRLMKLWAVNVTACELGIFSCLKFPICSSTSNPQSLGTSSRDTEPAGAT